MTARVISATEAARGFGDLLARVRYRGETFHIRRGTKIVATLGPAPRRPATGPELAEAWDRRPRLDPADAAAFARDLRAIRRQAGKAPGSPWER